MTFRFDDISVNTDMDLVQKMTDYMFNTFPACKVVYAVSPLVHRMQTGDSVKDQRVFPDIFRALSDHRNFYKVDLLGIPQMDERAIRAGHGLVHVDHRLLSKEAQELSIVASCSLASAEVFLPPFNKWNKDTEDVCKEHHIDLIRFEDGWLSMEHNDQYKPSHGLWYLHSREWTFEKFVQWFQKGS